jgi:hypothetical protein
VTPPETAAAFVRELLAGRASRSVDLPDEGFTGCLAALLADARREGAERERERLCAIVRRELPSLTAAALEQAFYALPLT